MRSDCSYSTRLPSFEYAGPDPAIRHRLKLTGLTRKNAAASIVVKKADEGFANASWAGAGVKLQMFFNGGVPSWSKFCDQTTQRQLVERNNSYFARHQGETGYRLPPRFTALRTFSRLTFFSSGEPS
jgi:hypothetical protein